MAPSFNRESRCANQSNKSNNLKILNYEFWKPNVEKQKYGSDSSIGETAWRVSISKILQFI